MRRRSHHEGDDDQGEIVKSAIQDATPQHQDGGSGNLDRSRNDAAGDVAEHGIASITGDVSHLVINTSTASSSFCPTVIAPTAAPSALAAAAAFENPVAAPNSGGDSFLGFGFDTSPKEVWEEDGTGGGGSRGRAPSSDNVDLGGGFDLGLGGLDAYTADIASSRERGREGQEEQEEGYAFNAEGR